MLVGMDVLVPIGEFSKMTHLSVKALRHYHDIGLLEPADIDRHSGYRRYSPAQAPAAQAIRRFRDLDMPLDGIRAVLTAPDPAARETAILEHLQRIEDQIDRARSTVDALRALLFTGPTTAAVCRRVIGPTRALAVRGRVAMDGCVPWITAAFAELQRAARAARVTVDGRAGALYGEDFFCEDVGDVVAFVPVDGAGRPGEPASGAGTEWLALPATEYAVLAHRGPMDELDRTYGALGSWVSERGIGAPGPICELYLAADQAEVCWPVTAAPTGAPAAPGAV